MTAVSGRALFLVWRSVQSKEMVLAPARAFDRNALDGEGCSELCWNRKSQHSCIPESIQSKRCTMYPL
jgi:hypothetical protein